MKLCNCGSGKWCSRSPCRLARGVDQHGSAVECGRMRQDLFGRRRLRLPPICINHSHRGDAFGQAFNPLRPAPRPVACACAARQAELGVSEAAWPAVRQAPRLRREVFDFSQLAGRHAQRRPSADCGGDVGGGLRVDRAERTAGGFFQVDQVDARGKRFASLIDRAHADQQPRHEATWASRSWRFTSSNRALRRLTRSTESGSHQAPRMVM